MSNPTPETVTGLLDVHQDSIRLVAVGAGELLDGRTLPYYHRAVGRALGPGLLRQYFATSRPCR